MNYLLIFPNHFSRLCRSLEECITHRDNGNYLGYGQCGTGYDIGYDVAYSVIYDILHDVSVYIFILLILVETVTSTHLRQHAGC